MVPGDVTTRGILGRISWLVKINSQTVETLARTRDYSRRQLHFRRRRRIFRVTWTLYSRVGKLHERVIEEASVLLVFVEVAARFQTRCIEQRLESAPSLNPRLILRLIQVV